MKVSITQENDTLNVTVEGRVNTDTAPELDKALGEKMKEAEEHSGNKVQQVFFDFAGVQYISSAGLRVILNVYKKLDRDTGKVVISGASKSVKEVFHITGFTKYLIMK